MENENVYWHLPGFCEHMQLYMRLFRLLDDHPEYMYPNYKIGSVYGSFPGAIWNGGRCVMGFNSYDDIKQIIYHYNNKGIPLSFTWTNQLIDTLHTYDTYCNLIMDLGDNGMNSCIVYSNIMEHYIRRVYSNYKLISSTTKLLKRVKDIKAELANSQYSLVVLHSDLSHDYNVLEQLKEDASRIEIMVNEGCVMGCKCKADHYYQLSQDQMMFRASDYYEDCPRKNFENIKLNNDIEKVYSGSMFLFNSDVEKLISMGYRNFKIVGREKSSKEILDSIIYFIIRDEYKELIESQLAKKEIYYLK